MDSKQKASVEKKIEKPQPLEDKKDSKTINQDDDFDKEIENYHEKKYRNSVYTHRNLMHPQQAGINSSFYDNATYDYDDFLKKKHLPIISKYEQIVLLSSDLNKKLEENSKAIEELTNELKKLKEDKKKKQSDIVNYLSNKESLLEIYKNKVTYLINQKK